MYVKPITITLSVELMIEFNKTNVTVSEDVGDVSVFGFAAGRTSIPVTVDIVFSGTATATEGS